jgi:uncharacterized repeat protein (TIGR01451 family)
VQTISIHSNSTGIHRKKSVFYGCFVFFATLLQLLAPQIAAAQTISQYTVADAAPGAVINDVDCGTTTFVSKTINVTSHITIADVNFGVHLTHTYRSDLRLTLKSPTGTTIALMTNTAGSGYNLNDLFDDEAAAAITSHNATVTDTAIVAGGTYPYYPISATYPYYSHAYRPRNALSAFDGQDAFGNWTFTVCDSVAGDVGNFKRADLFITPPQISAAKSSSIISDGVSVSNAKAVPGSVVQYCILSTNSGAIAATSVTPTDALPTTMTYVAGSLKTGTTCAGATTVEDDNNTGVDESDPFGASITGTTVRGSAPTLAAAASFALVFRATIN